MGFKFLKCLITLLIFTTALGQPGKHHNLQSVQASINPPFSIQRTKDCPSGSTLLGKSCVSSQIFQPDFVCPPSSDASSGDCLSFTKAFRICPDNFVQFGDLCSTTEVVASAAVCDKGEITAGQCRVQTEVAPTCPNGFEIQNGKCVRYTQRIPICPIGYQLSQGGNKCIKLINFPPSPVCPSDFSLVDGVICTKSIAVAPRCDSGFSLIGTECRKEVPRVLAPCQKGFKASNGSCYREQQWLARRQCPPDFILDLQNNCIKEMPVPPTCPTGTSRQSTGELCERFVAKRPVCYDGSELLDNGRCKQARVSTAELQCPNGYTLIDRECKKVLFEVPSIRCPRGVLENDKCVIRSSTAARIQCPSGYQVDKSLKCVRDLPYNESDRVVDPNRMKLKTEVVPVEFVCPNGTMREGKECTLISSFTPDVYCKVGSLDAENKKCVRADTRPSITTCKAGLIQPDATCLETEESLPMFTCPDGSELVHSDRCVVIVPQTEHPNKVVRENSRLVCDEGVQRGQMCTARELIPRSEVCPFGTVESSNGCFVTAPMIIAPPLVITRPPRYVCPNGSPNGIYVSAESCSTTNEIPPKYVCPDVGGVLKDSRCLYTTDHIIHPPAVGLYVPRRTCPPGYLHQGYQCSLTTTQPPRLECPPGYRLFEGGDRECVRSEDRVPVCPVGTEKTAGNCVAKTYVPPRVTEVKVCIKGQPGC